MEKNPDPRLKVYQELVKNTQLSKSENKDSTWHRLQEMLLRYSKPEIHSKSIVPGIKRSSKCLKCAEDLVNHRCKEFFCIECGEVGHVIRECPWKGKSTSMYGASFCELCKVRGHTASSCISRGYISEANLKNLRCFICRASGHARCDI
jgi:hydrogenase maturation factor HypF (carbamoyltransferase family)